MASEVDIYNMALNQVGHSKTVANPNEDSKEARICRAHFANLRDFALRDFDWNFARRHKALALSTDAAPTNWLYNYTLPQDCLKARRIAVPGVRVAKKGERIPFEVAGGRIFTDQPDAELIYTARVTDTTQFDSMFVMALAWLMVPYVAMGLVIKTDAAQMGHQNYRIVSSQAIAADMGEGFDEEPDPDFLSERD